MMVIIFFILGLAVGSFLNVVVYRLQIAEKMVLERSHCPKCRNKIAWYDNIPLISFVILKFRCRNCRERISWQYPLVEFATGILFVLVGYYFFDWANINSWWVTLYYFFVVSVLMAILVYDFLYLEIPSIVLAVGIFGVIVFNLWADIEKGTLLTANAQSFLTFSGVLAAIVSFSVFFTMVSASKETWMGMGDAYLVILLGLVVGWPNILLALLLAFTIGALVGVVLIALKKKKLGSQLPFAPFLVVGTWIAIFWYEPIINWYFGLFI